MNMEAVLKTIEGEISRLQRAADALRGNSYSGVNTNRQGRKRRKISAAGRRRIAAAQRARWAKLKAKGKA